jgi:hypothetical protein
MYFIVHKNKRIQIGRFIKNQTLHEVKSAINHPKTSQILDPIQAIAQ